MADVKLVFDVLANDKASPVLSGVHKAASGFGSALANIGQIASGVVLGAGLTQLPGKMLEFAQAAADDEQAAVRVSTVLQTLPGDFNENTAAVNAAIDAGQRKAFSDNEVRDSFVKLAVATGDSEEALSRQQLAMDLARGANIPLADASKLLGKVTDDNLQVFKKLGITLPDVANEADVLAAVQAKFAGQADAYANSTAGQFEQAKIAFGEVQESIGYALLPALTAVGRVLADNLPKIQAFVSSFSEGIGHQLGDVMDGFSEILADVFQGDLPGALDAVRFMIEDFGPQIEDSVKGWIDAFVSWIGPMIPVFLSELQEFAGAFLGWIGDAIPPLVEALAEWAAAFVDWIGPQIPPMLRELGHLLEKALAWLAAALPPILEKLGQWALAFVEWIAPKIPPMLLELAKLLLELTGWIITTALPAIVGKLVEWGAAFINWVGAEVLPKLPGALASIWDSIRSWIGATATSIGNAAVAWGQELASGFVRGLQGLGGQVGEAIRSAINSIHLNLGWVQINGTNISFNIPRPTIPAPNIGPFVPGFAEGTTFAPGGLAVVGERGPELVNLPRGSQVAPNGSFGSGGPVIAGDIVLTLDSREVARITRAELLKLGRRNGNAFGSLGVATP